VPASRQERLEGPASYVELAEAIVKWFAEIPVALLLHYRAHFAGALAGASPREAV